MNKNDFKEVGNSSNALHLEYAEIDKYFQNTKEKILSSSNKIHLSKLKFYYLRNEHLISIQYIYQQENDILSNNSDPSSFLYPSTPFFGPDPSAIKKHFKQKGEFCLIDEIELSLHLNEHIYQVKGYYDSDKKQITNFSIKTTRGQFVDFGPQTVDNFTWDCFFNQKIFEGFIIGWNSFNIIYLGAIFRNNEHEEEKETLADVTYIQHTLPVIFPYYQSGIFGPFDMSTSLRDPYANGNILDLCRKGKLFLEEINVYFQYSISKIDLFYKYVDDNAKRIKIDYTGTDYIQKSSKMVGLVLGKDEYINEYRIGYNEQRINWIKLNTNTNNVLSCSVKNERNVEKENEGGCTEKGANMLLGLVAGYDKSIMCMRFYYKKLKQ